MLNLRLQWVSFCDFHNLTFDFILYDEQWRSTYTWIPCWKEKTILFPLSVWHPCQKSFDQMWILSLIPLIWIPICDKVPNVLVWFNVALYSLRPGGMRLQPQCYVDCSAFLVLLYQFFSELLISLQVARDWVSVCWRGHSWAKLMLPTHKQKTFCLLGDSFQQGFTFSPLSSDSGFSLLCALCSTEIRCTYLFIFWPIWLWV